MTSNSNNTDIISNNTSNEQTNNNAIHDWSYLYTNQKSFQDKPIVLEAEVIHGFKRGSKELGIPTANLNMNELGNIGEKLETGIYYGIAYLNQRHYKTVVSVGWNPFYNNTTKTIEAHLILEHQLDDFYGEVLKIELYGYLRHEANFKSIEELISCINSDIVEAKNLLKALDVIPKL